MHQHQHPDARQYQYTPRTHVRERPLHWCIILVSLLFIFLLVIESVAFVVLGAWHLTTRRSQSLLTFSTEVDRRELSFGILLVIIGSLGILISILGLVAFFTLRLVLLRTVSTMTDIDLYVCIVCLFVVVCIMFMVCDDRGHRCWHQWHHLCMYV